MRTPLLLVAALAVAGAAPLRPQTDPGLWITADDYTPDLLTKGVQGSVKVALTVDAAGATTDCRVTVTSKAPDLDARTCPLLLQRAQFVPEPGRMPQLARVIVVWSHPSLTSDNNYGGAFPISTQPWISSSDYPYGALQRRVSGVVRMAFDISADGFVENCVVVQSSGDAELDRETCRLWSERARFKPALNAQGEAMRSQGRQTIKWQTSRK